MALKLKHKLVGGVGFLFLLLLLVGGVGMYFFVQIKNDSKVILKDNYESLEYCHAMQTQLDSLPLNFGSFEAKFNTQLKKQEVNVTEIGEEGATSALRTSFDSFVRSQYKDLSVQLSIRHQLTRVISINMRAIQAKNNHATQTADKAFTIISIVSVVVFLVSFSFVFNFPGIIVNPINQLLEGIKEIINQNYSHRLHLNREDELGDLANAFNLMAKRLDEYEHSNLAKLMFEKARAEAVINSLHDASIGIDKNNLVLFANQQALNLLGMKAADIVAKPTDEVKKRNDLFRFLLESNQTAPFKIVLDNAESFFTKDSYTITKGDDELGQVYVLKNITSFLEKDAAKTNFLATISHELKTPIASIKLSLQLLDNEKTGVVNVEQKHFLQSIKEDSDRLLKITSELLNISQIETGKIQLEVKPSDPGHLIEVAIQSLNQQAVAKGITIKKDVEQSVTQVLCDPDKTAWVLINLLSNAIRYSPDNAEIIISTKNNSKGNVRFFVQDFGKGIPIEYQQKIFDKYFQVPGSSSSGTGLGLAISKEFLIAMNGEIAIESEMGKGSVFYFDLPKA